MKRAAILLSACGVLCAIMALSYYYSSHYFLNNAITSIGTIIDFEKVESFDETGSAIEVQFFPMIEFNDTQGQAVQFVANISEDNPQQKKGTQVNILYLAEQPHKAKIYSWQSLWLETVVLVLFSLVFFTMAAFRFYR